MAGTKGNKNAEIWNEDAVLDKIEQMCEYIIQEGRYTLNSALLHVGLYPEWWSQMSKKFENNDVVSQSIKKLESLVEENIIQDTMVGDAKSAAFSIFLLKNKFGYSDKMQTEHSGALQVGKVSELFGFKDE